MPNFVFLDLMSAEKNSEKFAIRFGLGSIKAVGFGMTEVVVKERQENGNFKDIYDFAKRNDPRLVNKKSVEALAKSGAFDSIHQNRRQLAESFDVISAYCAEKKEEASSNQMSLFCGTPEADKKPELKKTSDWNKITRLQKEFESFGFFLNEHPLDDSLDDLRKRGVIFSTKLENDELEDSMLVKMAGVIAASKHRSSARGRFAYLTISDPFGIFEVMVFDEALITSARDILADGSLVALECMVRKDDGGTRISVRDVKKLDDFIQNTKASDKFFEDIKKMRPRANYGNQAQRQESKPEQKAEAKVEAPKISKEILAKIEITVKNREAIFPIKALLSQLLAPIGEEKFSEVSLLIPNQDQLVKILLPQKYFIGEPDLAGFRSIRDISTIKL
jgi:DNA polymerase-3 subunit alpha